MRELREETSGIQLWGGLECTVNRIGETYLDQFAKSGHFQRPEDLDLVAELGVRTLRYPVLWERTAPTDPDERDWSFADERLQRLRDLEISPIVGLVHHGSGPKYTNLLDDGFASGLAEHARAVAERYPWIEAYTPVNEPLTTARFSGMYGHWYPHATDPLSFAKALLNQTKAVVLSMAAIREINPQARLVQTEDLGKTHTTHPLQYQADYENERRWITWDLLCGKVDREHPMWRELVQDGIAPEELNWFLDHRCPPDVIGINYYLTSERFLDHRVERYPERFRGSNAFDRYADVEAVRVLAGGIDGASTLMRETWDRYGLPIAITECHLGCTREEQVRWLNHVWRQAEEVKAEGVDVRAVTVWSMFGAYDWCTLLTCDENRYEPGVFDLRAPEPRPTALAAAVSNLAQGGHEPDQPHFGDDGWWERPIRLLYEPSFVQGAQPVTPLKVKRPRRAPLLIVGAHEPVGECLAAACSLRGLEYRLVSRLEIDGADAQAARSVLNHHAPWAVINAARDAEAEGLFAECFRSGLPLMAFSGGDAFRSGGTKVESDPEATDLRVLDLHPLALLIRSGELFGPYVHQDPVRELWQMLRAGHSVEAESNIPVGYASITDLVHAALDHMLDGTVGPLHLSHPEIQTGAQMARAIANYLGVPGELVVEVSSDRTGRPTLVSERAWTMPPLDDALARSLDGLERMVREKAPALYLG